MKKRLLSAAAFAALCALAVPAHARSFDDEDWYPHKYRPSYESRSGSGYARDYADDDDDGERTYTRRGRSERATRQRPRSKAAHHAPREGTVTVRRVVTQPVPAQPLAAAPVGDITKPEVKPPAPTQQLAAIAPPPTATPDARPLVPFVEPRQPPTKRSARDGRNCLRPAARALLERIEAQFGAMQIISTCRPGARIAGSGRISKHATGEAVDFNAGKRKAEVVRWLIANHKIGGTMTYAGMSHIHVDVGQRFVALNSGGGGGSWRRSR